VTCRAGGRSNISLGGSAGCWLCLLCAYLYLFMKRAFRVPPIAASLPLSPHLLACILPFCPTLHTSPLPLPVKTWCSGACVHSLALFVQFLVPSFLSKYVPALRCWTLPFKRGVAACLLLYLTLSFVFHVAFAATCNTKPARCCCAAKPTRCARSSPALPRRCAAVRAAAQHNTTLPPEISLPLRTVHDMLCLFGFSRGGRAPWRRLPFTTTPATCGGMPSEGLAGAGFGLFGSILLSLRWRTLFLRADLPLFGTYAGLQPLSLRGKTPVCPK